MFIDVTTIRKAPGKTFHFDLREDVGPLTLDNDTVEFIYPVHVSLDVKNTGKIIVFNGRFDGDTELVCSRCVERYPYHAGFDFKEEFCHESDFQRLSKSEEVFEIEDVRVFHGNKVDLGSVLRENLYLHIPMKSVCNENCKGLCALCGVNLNSETCKCAKEEIDPRMEALKKYFDR
ncbi:YceD family protein [Phosphitispora sp. TUW77]|uniref:YceD family protein n=1 Tax=Phosphitispora sp. TUW77 TaxID=3152361 RepID=UPI003AB55E32